MGWLTRRKAKKKDLVKTEEEIRKLREAARIVSGVLGELARHIQPGVSAQHLDLLAERWIRARGAEPAFKGYRGYPATICLSIDEEVVHGIPHPDKVLQEGQIVTIDVGVRWQGYYGDCAFTFPVGQVSPEKQRLLQVGLQALYEGMRQARNGKYTGDIGQAIERFVRQRGFDVVRDMVGHGIGSALHEPPDVPNYGRAGTGVRLRTRMVLAIEPMVVAGTHEVYTGADQWTVYTKDGAPAVHFEHMVVVRQFQAECLTTYDPVFQNFPGDLSFLRLGDVKPATKP